MSLSVSNMDRVIAIDGPSGSGKSSIAKGLAKSLGVLYIDTGAMFRAIGFAAYNEKIPFEEGNSLHSFLNKMQIEYGISDAVLIKINGEDLTSKIREHHVSKLASGISQLPSVRTYLLQFQRDLAQDKICVMEGRDIGTVVFPNSFCKFFITASVEVRAKRRLDQLKENGDSSLDLDQIIVDVKKRDETDMNREFAPLKKADDAFLLDTSNLSMNEVIKILSNEVRFRASHCGFSL